MKYDIYIQLLRFSLFVMWNIFLLAIDMINDL